MAEKKRGFNLRSFITFSLVISTIIMSWSGIILYIAPPGRIANWGTWKLMLFTKSEWQALHTIFSYLFFILFVVHLFFVNWRTFLTYFRSKIRTGLNRKWELAAAVIISGIVFTGTLRNWTPFGPVMFFGEKVKEGWAEKFETPPAIHMENYSLNQLSVLFDSTDITDLKNTLEANGIRFRDSDTTLKLIAERNAKTPASIYEIFRSRYGMKNDSKKSESASGQGQGQGYGKYTLKDVSENSGIDLEVLIRTLKEKGLDADGQSSLRSVADQLGVTPREAFTMLTSK